MLHEDARAQMAEIEQRAIEQAVLLVELVWNTSREPVNDKYYVCLLVNSKWWQTCRCLQRYYGANYCANGPNRRN
jgi:hypothetical protein